MNELVTHAEATPMKPSDFGLTIRELLRYGHAGLLSLLIIGTGHPLRAKCLNSWMGDFNSWRSMQQMAMP
jgi:hypothetical protein